MLGQEFRPEIGRRLAGCFVPCALEGLKQRAQVTTLPSLVSGPTQNCKDRSQGQQTPEAARPGEGGVGRPWLFKEWTMSGRGDRVVGGWKPGDHGWPMIIFRQQIFR